MRYSLISGVLTAHYLHIHCLIICLLWKAIEKEVLMPYFPHRETEALEGKEV